MAAAEPAPKYAPSPEHPEEQDPKYEAYSVSDARGPAPLNPPDPGEGDAVRGAEILKTGIDFERLAAASEPDPHGFDFLRDLRAVRSGAAQKLARTLLATWIEHHEDGKGRPWQPAVAGERLVNWLCALRFVSAGAGPEFAKTLERSLTRHVRRLRRDYARMKPNADRFRVLKALVYAGVCLPGRRKIVGWALSRLEREITHQTLRDGGQYERNPSILAAVLGDLVELRACLGLGLIKAPVWLQHAVERIGPMVRFCRHGDGGLALFNGSIEEDPETIERLLAAARAGDRAPSSAPHSGFERLARKDCVVLVDTGGPPPRGLDFDAHAGTLSFEMSVGPARLVVNCGGYRADDPRWRLASRATAAHSTLVVEDTNSAEIQDFGGLGRRIGEVTVRRDSAGGGAILEAAHDGYMERFGLVHRRRLTLETDGLCLLGEDRLQGQAGHDFILRFHLHPAIEASIMPAQTPEEKSVQLRLADGQLWVFASEGAQPDIEESVYFGRAGRGQPSRQIVLCGRTQGRETPVSWSLRRAATASPNG
ncbi:MAG: heparinase II/III family protein [Alphaproteobacteria bacterium]